MGTVDDSRSRVSLFHSVEPSQLKPGDHIYVWRALGTYSHHGIYTGKPGREVIHFTGDGNNSLNLMRSKSAKRGGFGIRICGSSLDEFLADGTLRLVAYGHEENIIYKLKRPGTCHATKSQPADQVVMAAEFYLDHPDDWPNYNVFFNNCESFAVYCKTGERHTQQGRRVARNAGVFGVVALLAL